MKFGREYQESLLKDGFPAHWVDHTISYGKLKKCIKALKRELDSFGLDVETLRRLLEGSEDGAEDESGPLKDEDGDRAVHHVVYTFDEDEKEPGESGKGSPTKKVRKFIVPKLFFVVDEDTGEPLSATFSPETRSYLHKLAVAEKLTTLRITDVADERPLLSRHESNDSNASQDDENGAVIAGRRGSRPTRLVQVPLVSDSHFFTMLEKQLVGLEDLQRREQARLTAEIKEAGVVLSKAMGKNDKKTLADLEKWRKLFELYLDSRVFFVATERDRGVYNSAKAGQQWDSFLEMAKQAKLLTKFRIRESEMALAKFLAINQALLKSLRFQEMNQMAMTKILKKFDKRTSLGATDSFTYRFPLSTIPKDFSKALCAEVSSNIISVVPQLDDYLCPICMTLAYRPIRLKCGHLFCIRCLIVLQRQQRKECALCREVVVMEADSSNLDASLADYLARYFPNEVKAKQKANEQAVAVDRFGDAANDRCTMM